MALPERSAERAGRAVIEDDSFAWLEGIALSARRWSAFRLKYAVADIECDRADRERRAHKGRDPMHVALM